MDDARKMAAEVMQRLAGGAFDPVAMAGMIGMWGHTGWLGLRYHGHGSDWVELALPWREDLVGDEASGVLASGPIVSMMDMVTSMAVNQKLGANTGLVTIDLRVDYTRAAQPRRTVIGRGECYKLTRSIGFVRGIAYDETPDDPLAHVTGSFLIVDGGAAA